MFWAYKAAFHTRGAALAALGAALAALGAALAARGAALAALGAALAADEHRGKSYSPLTKGGARIRPLPRGARENFGLAQASEP